MSPSCLQRFATAYDAHAKELRSHELPLTLAVSSPCDAHFTLTAAAYVPLGWILPSSPQYARMAIGAVSFPLLLIAGVVESVAKTLLALFGLSLSSCVGEKDYDGFFAYHSAALMLSSVISISIPFLLLYNVCQDENARIIEMRGKSR